MKNKSDKSKKLKSLKLKWLLIFAIPVIIIFAAVMFFNNSVPAIDARLLLDDSLRNMKELECYRFTSETQVVNNEKQSYYAQISGEIRKPDQTHISGTILNTPIEVYLLNNTTYLKNEVISKWQVIENTQLLKTDILITELNPLQYLDFKETGTVEVLDVTKIDGVQTAVLTLQPVLADAVFNMSVNKFNYEICIDIDNKYVTMIKLQAAVQEDPDNKLTATIRVSDFNSDNIIIRAPEQ